MIVDASNIVWQRAQAQHRLESLAAIATALVEWKAKDFIGRVADPRFGSDGPYARPLVDGQPELWHVHMEPPRNDPGLGKWRRAMFLGQDKSSDAHLVYARRDDGLLILQMFQRDAHRIARMGTERDRQAMFDLARIASDWRRDRSTLSAWKQVLPIADGDP